MEAIMNYVQSFFGWLFQTTLIASVVICLILLIQKLLGGKLGPRWCHALWLVLLIRMVLPWAPSSRLSLFNLIPSLERQIQLRQLSGVPEQHEPSEAAQTSGVIEAIPDQRPEPDVTVEKQTTPKPEMLVNMQKKSKPRLASLHRVLPVIWLGGVLVVGAYLLVSNFALWRIVKHDRPLVNQPMPELFEECKAQIGVQSLVVVVPSDRIRSPSLFGFIRPRLLLPREMLDTATREEMRYVFLHELAHLRRHDIYLGWLASLLQVLHWFNPLIWFAFYRMRADRELACDALVLTRTGQDKSQEYGGAIVGLLRRFCRSRPLPAMAGILENRSQLKRRIAMIAQFNRNSYKWSPLAVVLIIILACVSVPDAIGSKKSGISWSESEPGISLRRIKTSPMSDLSGPPSLDGRYLCDVEIEFGGATRLVVRDLGTGEVQPLIEVSEGFPWSPVISPNNKRVAYIRQSLPWSPPKNELHVIKMDGTGHRVLHRFKEGEQFRIRMWTPDGKKVLGALWKGDQDVQLAAFSIEDGSMQVIHTFDAKSYWSSGLHKLVISPNARYVAYDRRPKEGSSARDIFILDIETQQTERVVQHPANDRLLGWTPDGNYIFFASNRRHGAPGGFGVTDTSDAYLLPVTEGRQKGTPQLVKRDIPSKMTPKGFTRDGTYYYKVSFRTVEAVVARLNLQTGKLLTKPQAVGQTGADQLPAWSPDGRRLAYCVHQLNDLQIIRIRNMATGQESQLDPNLPHFAWLRWAPDGESLLVSNFEKNVQAIYRINVSTGERVVVVQGESPDTSPRQPQLSLDGSLLYYVLFHYESRKASLIARDIESGQEEELFSLDGFGDMGGLIMFALSPDGRQLALRTKKKASSGPAVVSRILTMPTKGGEPRELWKTEEPIILIAWAPDGRSLLFTKRIPEGGRELWLVPVSGGQPRKLCSPQEMMPPGILFGSVFRALDVHPDGQRIAYDCFEYRHEVWAMENFLPEAPVAKSEPKMTLRRAGDWGTIWATISPDGKYLCDLCLSDPNNALVARELATGKKHFLVQKVNEGDYIRGTSPVISPDSKTVAYRWHDGQEKTFQLQLINLDGSRRRTIQSGENIIPEDWSPDGKRLLALRLDQPHWSENTQFEFVWVSVKDGSVQSITGVPKGRLLALAGEVALSPDGRFIAYDVEFPQPDGTSKYTIFLFSIEDGREVRIEHPAQEWLLGWTPDGKYIFFVSDRSGEGERDGWLLPVADGKPQGRARLVWPNIGRISARAGFTRSGDYYYGTRRVVGNVHTVGVDLKEGRALSGCEPIHPGLYGCPAWSPDGQYLAYYTEGPKNIRIRSLATGEERMLEPNLPKIRWFTWSPDGRSLLACSFWVRWIQKPTTRRVYQIDIKTGQSSVLMETDVGRIVRAELSPDQKSVFYTTGGGELLVRNLETGREKKISEFDPASKDCWDLSPDGKRLVIADADPNSSCQLKIISVKGEQLVELLPQGWDPHHDVYPWFRSVAWAPDGGSVLLSILKDYHHAVLWQISAKGGQPRQIFTTSKLGYWPSGFCMHPDGQLIAFQTMDVQDAGLWVMENFLPQDMGK